MNWYRIFLILVLPTANAIANGDAGLSLGTVLASSERHFPEIQIAVEEKLLREGRLTSKLGAFDLALEQESLVWADGFYDGVSADTRFVKRLPWSNTRLSAGYRATNDDFPVYQQELVTNDAGEFNVGVVLSLWRDRTIDDRRFDVESARLGILAAEINITLASIVTQRAAARAYWNWVAAGRRQSIYADLTDLAEGRMAGLERRVAEGDVAQIDVIENRQNLLRRKALLTNAMRDFVAASIELSLYLRDENGDPISPSLADMPVDFPSTIAGTGDPEEVINEVLARRPELAKLDNSVILEQQKLRLAENELNPRVDLSFKGSHDIGGGNRSRKGFEAIAELTLSIPLERRRGEGLVATSRARLRQLELERRLLENRLSNEIRKLHNTLEAARHFVEITAMEANLAETLEDAERKKFADGASDFFIVNLREERRADARIRNLRSQLEYFLSLTDYYAITVDLKELGL